MKKFGVKRLEARELAIDVLCDLAGALLFDLGIYNFAANAEFAPVGVSAAHPADHPSAAVAEQNLRHAKTLISARTVGILVPVDTHLLFAGDLLQ